MNGYDPGRSPTSEIDYTDSRGRHRQKQLRDAATSWCGHSRGPGPSSRHEPAPPLRCGWRA